MGLPDALLPYMPASPGPHPRFAGANRCAVWLAALTAVGRLVGRQVPRPVSAAAQLRRGLRLLSQAPGVDSCHPSPPLRATPGQGVNEAPDSKESGASSF